jgi:hypothetical protein
LLDRFGHCLLDHGHHAIDDCLGPPLRMRGLGAHADLAAPVNGHRAADDVGAAEVDADDEFLALGACHGVWLWCE